MLQVIYQAGTNVEQTTALILTLPPAVQLFAPLMVKHKVAAVFVLLALIILNAPASSVRVRAPIVLRKLSILFHIVLAYCQLDHNVWELGSAIQY